VLAARFYERFVSPRRASVVAMLDRAAARGEIAPVEHPEVISDLLTGPLLLRTVLPAIGPIDDTIIEATVDTALNQCRAADGSPGWTITTPPTLRGRRRVSVVVCVRG
jgi:hypothetical protein